MVLKIALRNVLSAGVRTWLNTFILSLTFTSIILIQGMNNGLLKQMMKNRISEELGNGQYWHQNYDPYDPLSLDESHAKIPESASKAVRTREAIPILMISGSVYPQGRVFPAILKGIPADQKILNLPFENLNSDSPEGTIPAMIGNRMAKKTELAMGDVITVRWRNSEGAFNAIDLAVVNIFNSKAPAMDQGQIWLSLENLQKMNLSPDHATVIISSKEIETESLGSIWKTKVLDVLLEDTYQLVKNKSAGSSIFYGILLFLAMIAIFDTQALSIFKRRKEIGTLMALGMTNRDVACTFTAEGLIHGVFAAILTLITGGPLCWYLQVKGLNFPMSTEQYGMAISNHLYSEHSPALIIGTFIIVMFILLIVSYMPARKIARLQPFEALRGKLS